MKALKRTLIAAAGLLLLMGAFRHASGKPSGSSGIIASPLAQKVQGVLDLVDRFYIRDPKPETVIRGALKGLISGLDEGSEYLTPFEYEQLTIEAKGNYVGVGVALLKKSGQWTFQEVIQDSPAARAGLRPGERLLAVAGRKVSSLGLEEVIRLLDGPAKSSVKLRVGSRDTKGPVREVELERETISMGSLGKITALPDGIFYLRCLDFSDQTPAELRDAIDGFKAKKVRGLMLDLRGNPGGVFEAGLESARLFLKKDQLIVSTRGRTPADDQVYRTSSDGPLSDLPLIVLVDPMTASAAEILSAALQENNRALLVGGKTYGKASIQSVFPLNDGSALRLTTAFYYTPSGKLIQGNGIVPDAVVIGPPDLSSADRAFKKAAQLLTHEPR